MKVKITDPSTGQDIDFSKMMLGEDLAEHTPADTDLPTGVIGVFFDADGICTVKGKSGVAVSGVPVIKGQPLWIVPKRVTAMTGPTKCFLVS